MTARGLMFILYGTIRQKTTAISTIKQLRNARLSAKISTADS